VRVSPPSILLRDMKHLLVRTGEYGIVAHALWCNYGKEVDKPLAEKFNLECKMCVYLDKYNMTMHLKHTF
jgi:hypothetical protein